MGGARGFFRRAVTQHLELKFLALVVALAIFYSREREESAERTLQVDLMMIGEESLGGLVRISPLPAKIEIAVRGSKGVVAGLRADQVGPVAIPINVAAGEGRIELRRDMFNLPDGVRMLWASPGTIDFKFERRAEKVVAVVPDIGVPDPDIVVDAERTVVEPAQVRVWGAESAVQAISDLRTEPIGLAGRHGEELIRDVSLRVPNPDRVSASESVVRVRIALRPDIVESDRTGLPVDVVKGTDFDAGGMLVYGGVGLRADVRVRGLRSLVERLDNSAIHLFARVDPSAFVDRDGDGVLEAEVPVEAERTSEAWSVVSIVPASLPMTWIPPVPPPPESAGGDGGSAAGTGDAGRDAGDGR